MCGIGGYSVSGASRIDRTLAAQVLLAGIAERGSDAVGLAYRGPELPVHVLKMRAGASAMLDRVSVAAGARQALVHVRDYTKGHPSLEANNHPIRHGRVVGIHNGVIANDDDIFAGHGIERAEPGMTVDSEAIFALVDLLGRRRATAALEELVGSMAAAWLDDRAPAALFLARGIGRPLWLATARHELLFASTPEALELAAGYLELGRYRLSEVDEGTLLTVVDGRPVRQEAFEPDRTFTKPAPPEVRAPAERRSCLARLAAITAAA